MHMKSKIILIILLFISFSGFSQYQGTIQDTDKEPLIGVKVAISGTNVGTISDLEGKYVLNANKGDTLIYEYFGYESQKIVAADKLIIDVILYESDYYVEEVVVMGYDVKNLTEISSAVTVVSEEDLFDVATNDIGTMLQGKVSGVQVVNSSGQPGSGAQIRIRGVSTIKPGNDEPLYVVDGIIGGSFDPNDVESVTVLKDAGATGMYGARANKGVLIVTTKSAKSGDAVFNFKTNFGYKIANHGNLKMMSSEEFYNTSSELYRDYDTHQIDLIKFYQFYPQELKTKNFNWVNETFKPSFIQNYYLSASGGTDKSRYYMSASYFDDGGTFMNTSYKRLNFRLNQISKISPKFSITNNLNISGSKGTYYDYMSMYYSYLSVPWDNAYDADGNPVFVDGTNHDWWSRDKINPIHSIQNSDYNSKGGGISYDLKFEYKFSDLISFNSNSRIGFNTDKTHNFVSPAAAGTYFDKGYINEIQSLWYGGITTNMLMIKKSFNNHDIRGLIGVEGENGFYEDLSVEGKNLPAGFDVPSVASSELKIGGNNSEGITTSLISQVNYNYYKKYFLTASYRIDKSSNFPPEHRVAKFPSISASWMINRESFLYGNKAVSLLKLRASWGIIGDPDIGANRYMGLFNLSSQYNANSVATPFQLQNYGLTWEKTYQTNIGLDANLFNRVSLSVDAYNNITKDLLVLVAQPLSQGFEFRWENQGQVTNKGIELAMDITFIQKQKLNWSFNFSGAYNKNTLSGFDAPIYRNLSGITQVYENDVDIYTFMLPKWLGVDEQTGAPLWEKFETDENGNIINREPTSNYADADPQKVGKALPDFQGGFGTEISYGRFTLSSSFAYQYGNKIYNFTRMGMDHDGHEPYYNYMQPKDDWVRWEKPGDAATHPSMQNNALSNQISSRFLEDGSFIKIRNIMLSYNVPLKNFAKNKIKALTLSLSADNLKSFTNYWGQDPEAALTQGDWAMPGVSDFKYPNSTQFIFNLDIKF